MTPKEIIKHYVDIAANNQGGYKAVTYREISAYCGVSVDYIKGAFGGEEMQFRAINHYIKSRSRDFNNPLNENEKNVMNQFIEYGEF